MEAGPSHGSIMAAKYWYMSRLVRDMLASFLQGSGMQIITARGNSIPLITRNSSVLSSMAESEPEVFTTGNTLSMSLSHTALCMVSSRASIRSALPRMVLISPLWAIKRLG